MLMYYYPNSLLNPYSLLIKNRIYDVLSNQYKFIDNNHYNIFYYLFGKENRKQDSFSEDLVEELFTESKNIHFEYFVK